LIEQVLRFAFKASNNQAEYEGLIATMLLAKEMGARSLLAKSDSLLVMGHVTGEYQAKDPQMAAYLRYVQLLKGAFMVFELVHVPREQNARVDLLAKLTSSGKGEGRGRSSKRPSRCCESLWQITEWRSSRSVHPRESRTVIGL